MQVTVTLGAQARRDSDRDPDARGVQRRRVWQPRARRAVPWLRRVGRRVPLPQHAGRRLRGLHQHGAGRGLSRLRPEPDRVRGGAGDGRAGARPGARPVRAAPPQHGAAGGFPARRAWRRGNGQLRAGPVPGPRPGGVARRQRPGAARPVLARGRGHGARHDPHHSAARAFLGGADHRGRRRRLHAPRRHGGVRQRDDHGPRADRRTGAGHAPGGDPGSAVRHRPARPRHRRLWQHRDRGRGSGDRARGARPAGTSSRRGGAAFGRGPRCVRA